MRRMREGAAAAAALGGLLLLLAGCRDSTGPADGSLGAAEADDFAVAEAEELEQSIAALSAEGAASGALPTGAGCAKVAGGADADGDGAPDEATYTFALPACRFTGFRGGTLEITGAIVLSDPTPAVADFAWQADLEEFRWAFTSPDASRSYAAVRNGTRVLTGDANGLSLTNDVTVVRTYPQRAAGAVEHDLVLEFTPADGVTLAVGEPLPDGTITKTGSFTWTRNGRSRHFVVTTIAPLVREASCTTALKIVSGEIRATLADGGYVRTVWTGCGEAPERSWVPGT